jgi:hypothetical protein
MILTTTLSNIYLIGIFFGTILTEGGSSYKTNKTLYSMYLFVMSGWMVGGFKIMVQPTVCYIHYNMLPTEPIMSKLNPSCNECEVSMIARKEISCSFGCYTI